MAYFARVVNNIVEEVVVVHGTQAPDEATGIQFLESNLKRDSGTWIQTWKNDADVPAGTTRRGFAGIGFEYDPETQSFKTFKPYPSWVWRASDNTWQAPVPIPSDVGTENHPEYVVGNTAKCYNWDEENQQWVNAPTRPAPPQPAGYDAGNPLIDWEWDPENQKWRYFDNDQSAWVYDTRDY